MGEELDRAIREIAEDRASGATALARRALAVLQRALGIEQGQKRQETFESVVEKLVTVRPSMSGLGNVVIRASRRGGAGEIADVTSAEGVEAVQRRVRALSDALETGEGELARWAVEELRGRRTLMTLSASGSVLAVMKGLAERSSTLPKVIVAESRPRCEGVDTARRLAEMGYRVSVIADAAVGHHVKECGAAVLGADSVLADGTVYNKMGSLPLALACRYWSVPLYVVTLAHKIRLTDDEPDLEEMEAAELGAMPEGVLARNVYFEAVPGKLVTAMWSDVGPLTAERIVKLRRKWLGGGAGEDHG